jgi:hypothetical protein
VYSEIELIRTKKDGLFLQLQKSVSPLTGGYLKQFNSIFMFPSFEMERITQKQFVPSKHLSYGLSACSARCEFQQPLYYLEME